MNDWLLLDYDRSTGIERWGQLQDEGTYRIRVTQRVDAILDANHEEASEMRPTVDGLGHKVGSVPLTILDDWHRQGLKFNQPGAAKDILKRIRDLDYSKLRTR